MSQKKIEQQETSREQVKIKCPICDKIHLAVLEPILATKNQTQIHFMCLLTLESTRQFVLTCPEKGEKFEVLVEIPLGLQPYPDIKLEWQEENP